MKFITNVRDAFTTDVKAEASDEGVLVEWLLITAGIGLVAVLAVTWIGTAMLNKGVDVATCIEGANTYGQAQGDAGEACSTQTSKTEGKSFTNDEGYKSRY